MLKIKNHTTKDNLAQQINKHQHHQHIHTQTYYTKSLYKLEYMNA